MPTPVRPPLALLAALLCAALSTGCGGGADDRALADASTAATATTTTTSARRAAAAAPARHVSIAAPADDAAVSPHDGLPDPSVSQPARVPPVAWPPVPPAAPVDASAPRD